MSNPRHILMQIQAVIGSHQRTEREIDDFCSWIEVQVMTELFAGMPKDKQEKAINQFMILPPDKKESVFYCCLTDIEQVKNEKKSFTFRWILRQKTLAYSGKGQQWRRSMWNV